MKIYISDWVNIVCVCLMIYLAIMMKLEIHFLNKKIEDLNNNQCIATQKESNDYETTKHLHVGI